MGARRVFIVALAFCLGTGIQALAMDGAQSDQRPDHYQSLNRRRAENQVLSIKQNSIPQRNSSGLSQDVHGVNILTLSPSDTNAIPATHRPSGSLQLDKVVIVEPK